MAAGLVHAMAARRPMWQGQNMEGKVISDQVRDIIEGQVKRSFIGHCQDFGFDSETGNH